LEFEKYLLYLHNQKHLNIHTIRSVQRALTRFSLFLANKSLSDLGAVNLSLLQRYLKTFLNLAPQSAHMQLLILRRYLDYIATTRE
jgi:site-specific recombinase XerD